MLNIQRDADHGAESGGGLVVLLRTASAMPLSAVTK